MLFLFLVFLLTFLNLTFFPFLFSLSLVKPALFRIPFGLGALSPSLLKSVLKSVLFCWLKTLKRLLFLRFSLRFVFGLDLVLCRARPAYQFRWWDLDLSRRSLSSLRYLSSLVLFLSSLLRLSLLSLSLQLSLSPL